MRSGAAPRPILLCATGVMETGGGIASSNRNLLAGLQTLAARTGTTAKAMVLLERSGSGYAAFGGDKLRFALGVLKSAPAASLVVFDHVRIATPFLAIPRPLRPPIAIIAHGSEASHRIRPLDMRAFRAADLVLTNSNLTLERMRRRFSGFRGVACPLGLPPQFSLSPAVPKPSKEEIRLLAVDGVERALGRQVLLLVGRMDAQEREKGHRELLAILPALAERYPEVQLVFAGDGTDYSHLERLAKASPAAGQIFLTGRVTEAELQALYRRAYAYVMPSRQEGFGLVYLEAMNYAKPCLACRGDGGAEIVRDGETGILIDQPIREAELLEGVSELLADPARARRYGEAGWRRLNAEFTASASQARIVEQLGALLESRARPASPGAQAAPMPQCLP
jgi:phosphatidylinositol alpha-1,6-mannosyltransferase